MGAGQSLPSQNQPPSKALHVLRVTPSSPASKTTIEPFFDFVVGFEGDTQINAIDVGELEKIVESHEGQTLNLVVWSSKDQESRVVPITPSREWAQDSPTTQTTHPDEIKPSLLGLSMRMCEPEFSLDSVWHVLDVLEGSPAESAGLVPYGDWIIGWSGGVLGAEGDFYDVVEAHVEKPLRVYVYSYDFDTIREVVLVPNRQWGGEGLLGCVFGFGLLHRIPPPPADREPGAVPPELFEIPDDFEEQQLFVPADVPQRGVQYNGWGQNFHSLEEEFEEEEFPTHNGHNGHASSDDEDHHSHDHDHHHTHDHQHKHGDHEHGSDHSHSHHESSSFRVGSSNRPRVMTPTGGVRNGSGSYTNGIGLAGIRSQAYDRTTTALARGQGEYPYEDYDEEAVTEDSEEVMSDDGDDSGSLTSVD